MELNLITDLISGAQTPATAETAETGLEGLFLQLAQQVQPQAKVDAPVAAAAANPTSSATLGDLLQSLLAAEEQLTEPVAETPPLETALPTEPAAPPHGPEGEIIDENEEVIEAATPPVATVLPMPTAPNKASKLEHDLTELPVLQGASDPHSPKHKPLLHETDSAKPTETIAKTTAPNEVAAPSPQATAPDLQVPAEIVPMAPPILAQNPAKTPAHESVSLPEATPIERAAQPQPAAPVIASFAERFFTQDYTLEGASPTQTPAQRDETPIITAPSPETAPPLAATPTEAPLDLRPQEAEIVVKDPAAPREAEQVIRDAKITPPEATAEQPQPEAQPAANAVPTPPTTQPRADEEPARSFASVENSPKPVEPIAAPGAAAKLEQPSEPAIAADQPKETSRDTEAAEEAPAEPSATPVPEANPSFEKASEPPLSREALQGFALYAPKELPQHSRSPMPVLGPELAQSVSQQVSTAIAAAPDRPVELTLSPEELGRVRLSMHSTDTAMVVTVQADRQDTLDLMRRHIDTLAKDFRDLGFSDISSSFSQNQQQSSPPSKSEARPETPFSEVEPSAQPIRISLTPARSGLDLRI